MFPGRDFSSEISVVPSTVILALVAKTHGHGRWKGRADVSASSRMGPRDEREGGG